MESRKAKQSRNLNLPFSGPLMRYSGLISWLSWPTGHNWKMAALHETVQETIDSVTQQKRQARNWKENYPSLKENLILKTAFWNAPRAEKAKKIPFHNPFHFKRLASAIFQGYFEGRIGCLWQFLLMSTKLPYCQVMCDKRKILAVEQLPTVGLPAKNCNALQTAFIMERVPLEYNAKLKAIGFHLVLGAVEMYLCMDCITLEIGPTLWNCFPHWKLDLYTLRSPYDK